MNSLAPLRVLSDSEIASVREATEDLLETRGVQVQHEPFLRRAAQAGAEVNPTSGVVRIPRTLLRELLAMAPPTYEIRGASGARTPLGGENQHCHAIVTDPWIIDYQTRQPRRPRLEDLRRHTAIAQQLAEVVMISRMDFPVADIEGPESSLCALEQHLLLHDKHNLVLVADAESIGQWLEIGRVLGGGRDPAETRLLSLAVAVVSPLTILSMNAQVLMTACAHDLPILPTICPMAGMTSPYTLAATLLQGNAENCFLAAACQMLQPGHPFLYAFGPSVSDMRSGHELYYTLDKVLWKTAAVQMAKSYGLPCMAECGGALTGRYDQQNGAEGMLFMLSAVASGANLLTGIGSCHNAVGMSAEMMLIHTAWLAAARHLRKGLAVDRRRLGLDSIKAAGPQGYLTDDLTLEFLRGDEFFTHDLFDFSGGYTERPSLLERAHARAEEMSVRCESPLPGEVQENLRRLFHDQWRIPTRHDHQP